MLLRKLLALASLALVTAPVHAQVQTFQAQVNQILPGATASVSLPRFDRSIGVLHFATLKLNLAANGTVGLENTSGTPIDYTFGLWYTPYWHTFNAVAAVTGTPVVTDGAMGSYSPPAWFLAAYDGVTDFAGTSGKSISTTGSTSGTDGFAGVVSPYSFDLLCGTGNLDVTVGPLLHSKYWEGGSSGPAGVVIQSAGWFAKATVRIEYYYTAHGTTFCGNQLGQMPLCPCSNLGTIPAGCGNSVNAAGGLLSASGTASISNDTLALQGSQMTDSSAVYFQGASFVHLAIDYGDGLRCVTGSLTRLGTRPNVTGASSVPAPGNPTLSIAGGVATPGTRYYQVAYRDTASFCTPATFNMTNAVSVVWTP